MTTRRDSLLRLAAAALPLLPALPAGAAERPLRLVATEFPPVLEALWLTAFWLALLWSLVLLGFALLERGCDPQ